MNLSPRYLIKLIEQHGFVYKRTKGSHQLYYNPAQIRHWLSLYMVAKI